MAAGCSGWVSMWQWLVWLLKCSPPLEPANPHTHTHTHTKTCSLLQQKPRPSPSQTCHPLNPAPGPPCLPPTYRDQDRLLPGHVGLWRLSIWLSSLHA